MSRVVDPRNLRPDEVEVETVYLAVVKVSLCYPLDEDGKPQFRVYSCPYGGEESGGLPQGNRLVPKEAKAVAEALFPVIRWAGLEPSL